jgi:DNA-binding PadR family transcriptional regulator
MTAKRSNCSLTQSVLPLAPLISLQGGDIETRNPLAAWFASAVATLHSIWTWLGGALLATLDWGIEQACRSSKRENNITMIREQNSLPADIEELVLLAILRLEPNAYGVAIQELIETATQRGINVRQLYATLNRLRIRQWIRGKPSPTGAPESTRLHYEVCVAGRHALNRAAQARGEQEPYKPPSLAAAARSIFPVILTEKEVICESA